jgi:LPXTG-motif cell wall-anchored protein
MADNFDIDENEKTEPPQPSPAPASNRTFIITIAALGGLFLLALIVMAIFLAIILPQSRAARDKQSALINSNNTATVAAVTTEAKNRPTATSTRLPPTATSTATIKPSATSVVAQSTKTQVSDAIQIDPRTATVSALLTQASDAKLTATFGPTTTQALPKTGFADDFKIPGLIGISILLLVVIFLVRRMRATPAS